MHAFFMTTVSWARLRPWRLWRTWALLAIVCALLAGSVAHVGSGSGMIGAQTGTPAATPVPASGGVVREVLSRGNPAAAPGELLELVRYTIPAGTQLPAHTHPGMQAATIVSGTLQYTVLVGEVPITRAPGGDPTAPAAATAGGGEVAIGPGDAFVEAAGVVHFGRNAGPEPVVILVASLFTSGAPPASLIDATPGATPER